MKSLLFTAILSLRKRSEQILIKFAILLQVRLTHAHTFFRGVYLSTLQDEPLLLTHCAHAHCLQFEHSGNGLMSHVRETSKVTINTSYFHPAQQHYTDEAQKAETVPSLVRYCSMAL